MIRDGNRAVAVRRAVGSRGRAEQGRCLVATVRRRQGAGRQATWWPLASAGVISVVTFHREW